MSYPGLLPRLVLWFTPASPVILKSLNNIADPLRPIRLVVHTVPASIPGVVANDDGNGYGIR